MFIVWIVLLHVKGHVKGHEANATLRIRNGVGDSHLAMEGSYDDLTVGKKAEFWVRYAAPCIRASCSFLSDSAIDCPDCSLHKTCVKCLDEFQCGWCGNVANPLLGVCTEGDFGGGRGIESCSRLVAGEYNITGEASWSYEMCPTVDECKLGVYECHPNASCQDTISSYDCKCKQGFRGDGVNSCERT